MYGNPKEIAEQLFRACLWEQKFSGDAAYHAAYSVWSEILQHVSLSDARKIFLHFGKGPPKRYIKKHANAGILFRLSVMGRTSGGENIEKLARIIAAENEEFNRSLPDERKEERRQTNVASIAKHIRRLRDARRERVGTKISTGAKKKKSSVKGRPAGDRKR
ncbi:hypothetical protein AYJ54_07955 [Bradyrhizobium centrolobii]|uniref:Uncharacterized protein n=1 Tax=Bradyrhizobium centrolobii TaxID=1505087 RepID=A0A176YX63_9BRAD|nr:hypothetical protein [Bradyrhizobium centrolobii]OAF11784.1 hypothetical protein AYJ54_07955 [Bradyrhizobium centrolobii]